MKVTLLLALGLCLPLSRVAQLFSNPDIRKMNGRRSRVKRMQTAGGGMKTNSNGIEVLYFSQKVNHFYPQDQRTFDQRFMTNHEHYQSNNRIFLFIGGGHAIDESFITSNQSNWMVNARLFGADCFMLEHRYFGESLPTEDATTPNLDWLTTWQALADIAFFISIISQNDVYFDPKWILFGCSYGGSLAAWFRLKYPHLAIGAVASSPGVEFAVNAWECLRVVRDTLRAYSATCVENIALATSRIEERIKNKDHLEELDDLFDTCEPVNHTYDKDTSTFFHHVYLQLHRTAMQSSSNEGTEDGPKISRICDLINGETEDVVERYGAAIRYSLEADNIECMIGNYDLLLERIGDFEATDITDRLWYFLSCTQLGMFETSDLAMDNPFSHRFGADYFYGICIDTFGQEKDIVDQGVAITNKIYGGKKFSASRIVIVNGMNDPWHPYSITYQPPDDILVLNIEGSKMYIKQVVIDGFKSYVHRTVLEDFDPQFNAITGLNGSGKSNILDAICFVLGLSNLSQARVNSLQELVYKSGITGVNKASVSVVFDNRTKENSPIGYESYNEITVTRQVLVGGRSKYLINGVNVANYKAVDLFHSVQLSIDNPHFLIMQGRVTKVLNMKPKEILALIEEAVGTKMYEKKRNDALKEMVKKDLKLEEVRMVLEETVQPNYERIKESRHFYMEYQKLEREIEFLTRLDAAYNYVTAKEAAAKSVGMIENLKTSVEQVQKQVAESEQQMAALQREIEAAEEGERKEQNTQLEEKENVLKEKQKNLAVCQSSMEDQTNSLKDGEKRRKELAAAVDEDVLLIEMKRREFQQLQSSNADLLEAAKNDSAALELAQKRVQALSTGMTVDESGEKATLEKQLIKAKDTICALETENKQIIMKVTELSKEVQKRKKDLEKSKSTYNAVSSKVESLKKEISVLENNMEKIKYDQKAHEQLQTERQALKQQIQTLESALVDAESNFPRLNFSYTDPEPNFDRSRVKGLVANLINLKDPKVATAIEVVAGESLYNVVVDTEETGKLLLQKGQLQRRVTLIPLNKIMTSIIPAKVVERGKSLVGNQNCDLALDLITYDPAVTKAMQFVFGRTLVCDNMDHAKKVAFDGGIMKRTVTLGGEIFNPEGTLTGGARRNQVPLLKCLNEFNVKRRHLAQCEAQMKKTDAELAKISAVAARWNEAQQNLQLKSKELELQVKKLENTPYGVAMSEIAGMESSLANLKITAENNANLKVKEEKRAAELQENLKHGDLYKQKEMKQAEQDLAAATKRAAQSDKKVRDQQQKLNVLEIEISELEKVVQDYREELVKSDATVANLEARVAECTEKLAKAKAEVQESMEDMEELKNILREKNQQIAGLRAQQEALTKNKREKELQIKRREQEIKNADAEGVEAKKAVAYYLNKYSWIPKEEPRFGITGGQFDFKANRMSTVSTRLEKAQTAFKNIERNVDIRCLNELSRVQNEYYDLISKRRKIQSDKVEIQKFIEKLDKRKVEAIEAAWQKVSKDFDEVFALLLPGTKARLERIGGKTLEGLEIRVAMGNVWKDYLTELSGGQKSLVALALIFAILMYKPAPLYILDEVDAALDLSHTVHIGNLISEKFKQSQFIVVSLKDGMFNNANVLYRTTFEDGTSRVTRYARNHEETNTDKPKRRASKK